MPLDSPHDTAPRAAAPIPSQPFCACPREALAGVLGVFTDIDDTLTRDGAIEPQALAALQALHHAGRPAIAITGRPLGWSAPFARDWPVAAVVAENGGVALIKRGGKLVTEYAQDEAARTAQARRLAHAQARVLAEVPGTVPARDSPGRVTDIAIDHGEFAQLGPAGIAAVVDVMRSEGLSATVSSIHINGWLGDHSKWTGAEWMVKRLYGRDLSLEIARWVYVGDSTNDQAMFGRFGLSVGVANLQRFAKELRVWPRFITQGERGSGFAEVVQAVLAARSKLPLPPVNAESETPPSAPVRRPAPP